MMTLIAPSLIEKERLPMNQTKRPNIVLITTDTQRWDTLHCMGSEFAKSPHLDRLASEGVLFTQGHTSSPVCSPARSCLMTGVHTPVHGCIENGIKRQTHFPVFPDFLKEQGYTNIMVGKCHFGPIPDSFDVVHETTEKGSDTNDAYAKFIRPLGYSRASSHPNPVPEELFMEAFLVDTSIRELERATAEDKGPFFLFCSMVSPHAPIDPPGRWAHLYDDVELPPINYTPGEIAGFPEHLKRLLGLSASGDEDGLDAGDPNAAAGGHGKGGLKQLNGPLTAEQRARIDAHRKLYYGLAAYCDHQVGRLLDYLDRSGLWESTLIIFTSDHGQAMFDHGFDDKHNYYDESWRVPFIMSMPGTLPAGERRDFATWNDIPATILAAAGTECKSMQSLDLFTPLAQGEPSPRRCAVASLYKSAAFATARWKLEYYFEERRGRLFDRLNDPQERVDLFNDPAHSHVRQAMVEALLNWRSDIVDVKLLADSTAGGGPVAKRIAPHTKAMRGADSELRLNQAAVEIEERMS
jgi:arylsulfatase A-like enzyme